MKNKPGLRFAVIIPARYASTRFPGKALAMIGRKYMIQRVYEQAHKSVETVYIATDDQRIYDATTGFGGNAVFTSASHTSGTDRCAEAAKKIMAETGKKIDVVINVQGDEPFIKPEQIDLLKSCFYDENVTLATLIRKTAAGEDIFNHDRPKVIVDVNSNAIYFSRTAVPFIRDHQPSQWTSLHSYFMHLGLYAYRSDILQKITLLPPSPLEKAESLEQNRWIENGYTIRCAETNWESFGIDTPEDLEKAINMYERFI
jgi:3-deoxy-manno-octulosonate cytidylyltransferase (CMP-KDO synthetase)